MGRRPRSRATAVALVVTAAVLPAGTALAGFTAPLAVETSQPPVDRSCTWTATGCVIPPPEDAVDDAVDGWRRTVGGGLGDAGRLPDTIADQPFRGPAAVIEAVGPHGIDILRGANELSGAVLDDLRDRVAAGGDLLDGLVADPTGVDDHLTGTPLGVLLDVVAALLLLEGLAVEPPPTDAPAPEPATVVAALLALEPDPVLVLAALDRLVGAPASPTTDAPAADTSPCDRLTAAAAADPTPTSDSSPLTAAAVAAALGCPSPAAAADQATDATDRAASTARPLGEGTPGDTPTTTPQGPDPVVPAAPTGVAP